MKQVTVTVVDPVGLHARPATVAVNAASKFKSEINVKYFHLTQPQQKSQPNQKFMWIYGDIFQLLFVGFDD